MPSFPLHLAIVSLGLLWAVLALATPRVGRWASALLIAVAGWLALWLLAADVLATRVGSRIEPVLADPFMRGVCAGSALVTLGGLTAFLVRGVRGTPAGRSAAAGTLAAVGLMALGVSLVLVLAGPWYAWIIDEGAKVAAREYGPGISRRTTYSFWGLLVPLLVFVVGLFSFLNAWKMRHVFARRLADPQPKRLPVPAVALVVFVMSLIGQVAEHNF